MKPLIHSKNHAKDFGGTWENYIQVDDFIDSSKATHASMKHRCILHSAFGIYIVEKVFGTAIKNSDGLLVSVRDIAENHILQDLGFIPSTDDWLGNLTLQSWMLGGRRKQIKKKFIKID